MDFIMIPLVVGIITYGIYSLFELFARRKERLILIEKIGEKFDPFLLKLGELKLPTFSNRLPFSFNALKWGSLLLGIGFGLLFGFMLQMFCLSYMREIGLDNWDIRHYSAIIYGASMLLFGGLALVISFLMEKSIARKEVKERKKDNE